MYLIKLVIKQLISNKITVFNTLFLYPRTGIKQGGVLSGYLFSCCYDELVSALRKNGSGILLIVLDVKRILIQIIVYADDIILFARSPYGLRCLISITMQFANKYDDLCFNPQKSWILHLGSTNKPAISVCGIPTSECQQYLGVPIGRASNFKRDAASKLYSKTNILLNQNKDLQRCSTSVKNLVINSYGTVSPV